MTPVFIAGRRIGAGAPCWIVAEAGINHNGSARLAQKLVSAARRSGADAVKFQSFVPERLVSPSHPYFELFKKTALSPAREKELFAQARRKKIAFFSTPFDEESASRLVRLGVPAIKISSGDLTHLPLLTHVAKLKRPVILSTGAGTVREIDAAVDALRQAGARQIVLLHCVSNYPTLPEQVNLRTIRFLEERYRVPAGFSDHTTGIDMAVRAVLAGACVIEKHFTLDTALPGPDHRLSADPRGFADLVRRIRQAETFLGRPGKIVHEPPGLRRAIRRGIHLGQDVAKGGALGPSTLVVRRPEAPFLPRDLKRLIGRKATRPLTADQPLKPGDVAGRYPPARSFL